MKIIQILIQYYSILFIRVLRQNARVVEDPDIPDPPLSQIPRDLPKATPETASAKVSDLVRQIRVKHLGVRVIRVNLFVRNFERLVLGCIEAAFSKLNSRWNLQCFHSIAPTRSQNFSKHFMIWLVLETIIFVSIFKRNFLLTFCNFDAEFL